MIYKSLFMVAIGLMAMTLTTSLFAAAATAPANKARIINIISAPTPAQNSVGKSQPTEKSGCTAEKTERTKMQLNFTPSEQPKMGFIFNFTNEDGSPADCRPDCCWQQDGDKRECVPCCR
jgi:hypothetical protein